MGKFMMGSQFIVVPKISGAALSMLYLEGGPPTRDIV